MFKGCTSLNDANIEINAVADSSCYDMFMNCKALKNPIKLAATTLYNQCYTRMFYGSGITTAPTIHATTLANYCCNQMFRECADLSGEIRLFAQTLYNSCYQYMFYYSKKVNYIMMIATDVSAASALANWVYEVASTGIFVKHIEAQWTTTGNSGVPTNWTVIYYDPALDKYYLDQQRSQECDDHGNPI